MSATSAHDGHALYKLPTIFNKTKRLRKRLGDGAIRIGASTGEPIHPRSGFSSGGNFVALLVQTFRGNVIESYLRSFFGGDFAQCHSGGSGDINNIGYVTVNP